MSDLDDAERLARAVRWFAQSDQETNPIGRKIWPSGEMSLENAVLQEIGETVLRRILTFKSPVGVLSLDVAERRILKVLEAPEKANANDIQLDSENVGIFCSALEIFGADASEQEVFVSSELPSTSKSDDIFGISVCDVSLSAAISKNGNEMQYFRQAVQKTEAFAMALVESSAGNVTNTFGDSKLVQQLTDVLSIRSGNSETKNVQTKSTIWTDQTPDGLGCLHATLQDLHVIAVFSITDLNKCLVCWSDREQSI